MLYMSLGRKNIFAFTYTINNMPARRVQCETVLCVSAARDLFWNSFINTLVSKCNRILGMIKRYVGYPHINVTSYL